MDIYAEITNRIMEQMENGVIPWRKPWVAAGSAVSHATGKSYSLLNQMLLGRPGEYLTFKQVQAEGGKVRKGAKAQMVVFWKWITVTDDETQEEKEVPILRYYNVFHIDQCEGLKAKHMPELPNTVNAHETAEQIINSYTQREGVALHQSEGDRAFYRPSSDSITVPHMAQFTATAEYYSTVFHEMVHSTGHAKRLNRIDKTAFFGIDGKSFCLSGDFEYGKKAEVEEYFIKRGGILAKSVNKKTDYLIVGKHGSAMWSTGNYGNKVKKAMELQEKGIPIQIIKEEDITFQA